MASRIHTLVMAAGLVVLTALGTTAAAVAAADPVPVPAPVAGPGNSTFGIQPLPQSATDTRALFSYDATPGAIPKDVVRVDNYSSKPLHLHLYASDAYNTPEGGYDLLPGSTTPTDVGAWVKFQGVTPFLLVPAGAHQDIPFTLTIPVNATPGDHSGGIVVSLTTPSVDSKGNRVNVEQRVGTRIHIRVAGTLRAAMDITQVSATYHTNWNPFGSGSVAVTYTVKNTGNVRLAAKQAVRVTSLLGGSVVGRDHSPAPSGMQDIGELLPGNTIQVTAYADGVLPSFTSTARISVDPIGMPGDLDPKLVGTTRTATMITPPWAFLILLALLGGLGFEVFRRRRRRMAPSAPVRPAPASASKSKPTPKAGAAAAAAKAAADAVSEAVTVPVTAPESEPAESSSSEPVRTGGLK